MEKKIVYENNTAFNQDLIKRYMKSFTKSFKCLIVFIACFAAILAALAITTSKLVWIAFGLVIVCAIILTITNMKAVKQCRMALEKYEGCKYQYIFYEDEMVITYNFKEEEKMASVNYTEVKNVYLNNGLLALSLKDNTALFVDVMNDLDKDSYQEIFSILTSYTNKQ